MQPGPVTATAITIGSRNRYAGTLLAIGHGIIEFPLMVVIILGMEKYFKMPKVQITIGLAGGVFLLLMAIQAFLSLRAKADTKPKALHGKPILAGIILTASNPYFLVWWATVGLALATQAVGWGIWAFIRSFCGNSLVRGFNLAANSVLGQFQRLGVFRPTFSENSIINLCAGTIGIWFVFYI